MPADRSANRTAPPRGSRPSVRGFRMFRSSATLRAPLNATPRSFGRARAAGPPPPVASRPRPGDGSGFEQPLDRALESGPELAHQRRVLGELGVGLDHGKRASPRSPDEVEVLGEANELQVRQAG